MSAVYELPFGQGKHYLTSGPGKWILGGWQLNGLWSWESGLPLDISTSTASLNAPGNINRPNVNGPVQIFGGIGPGTQYFDKSDVFGAGAKHVWQSRPQRPARARHKSTLMHRFSGDSPSASG